MKKEKKQDIYDDGRTIVNMNVEGMPWYNPNRTDRKKKNDPDRPRFRERLAMIFGGYRAILPFVLVTILAFALTAVIIYLWLH